MGCDIQSAVNDEKQEIETRNLVSYSTRLWIFSESATLRFCQPLSDDSFRLSPRVHIGRVNEVPAKFNVAIQYFVTLFRIHLGRPNKSLKEKLMLDY